LAVVTLAVGIGANSVMFSFVNTVLLQPLNFTDPGQVFFIWEANEEKGFSKFTSSPANFFDFREQATSFDSMAAYSRGTVTLIEGAEPERFAGVSVSADFFDVARTNAVMGRTFVPDEMEVGADGVVLLSHGLWMTRFGGDPEVLGRSLNVDGVMRTVIGVTDADFDYPIGVDLWTPLSFNLDPSTVRGAHYLVVIGRLQEGVSQQQAQGELDTITGRLEDEFPETNQNWEATLYPMHGEIVDDSRTPLLALFGAVGLLLLIVCANVANLVLARNSSRYRELAIRAAMGAGRIRIVRQLLAESLLLSLSGGFLGLGLAYAGLRGVVAVAPSGIPRLGDTRIDGGVLLFTLCVSLATGLVVGLAPALRAARHDLNDSLRIGGASGFAGAGALKLRSALVVAEVAVALVVVIGSGLLTQRLWRLMAVDGGFDSDSGAAVQVSLPSSRYPDPSDRALFYDDLVERALRLPGVTSVGAANQLPMTGMFNISYEVAGRPLPPGVSLNGELRFVHPDYFETIGIPLLRGRGFTSQDNALSPEVVIINESLARAALPDEDPVGMSLDIGYGRDNGPRPRQIVGIVRDVREAGLDRPAPPAYYVPYRQDPFSTMLVVVRSSVDATGLVAPLRREVREMDPELAILAAAPVDEIVFQSLAGRRFTAQFLGGFAGAALLLAVLGIYGVMSFSVTQRRAEIGVRMALGASGAEVLVMVLRKGLMLSVVGIVTGLAASALLTRYLSSMLFEVQPTDPATFAGVSAILISVSVLASLVPALRATRIDPLAALRSD
jgi:putative ABC transport system permease protein